ncbi:hypothetical protein ACFSVJ_20810 [Prauserella oleivorans]
MGNAADIPSLIRTGVVDLGSVAPAYVPAELPLSGVADLPGLVGDSCTGSLAVSELMSEGGLLWREDFEPKGLRPLVVGMIPDYDVLTGSRPVRTPSDLRGLQLRSSGEPSIGPSRAWVPLRWGCRPPRCTRRSRGAPSTARSSGR